MDHIRMTTVIERPLHEKLKSLAKVDGRTTMRYVEKLLQAHVAKMEKKGKPE